MLAILVFGLLLLAARGQYSVVGTDVGTSYVKLALRYSGTQEYYVKPKSKVVKDLIFHFKALTYNDFSFKIYDPNE